MKIALTLLTCLLSFICFAEPENRTLSAEETLPHLKAARESTAEAADFRRAAERGSAGAQSSLGWCYEHGDGVEVDAQEAVRWYKKAAEQGHPGGQCNLGSCYERGVGVEKDAQEAVRWYKKAAEQGHKGGLYNLGRCYERGVGVEKDVQEAVRWYKAAAKQRHRPAITKLKEMGISTLD